MQLDNNRAPRDKSFVFTPQLNGYGLGAGQLGAFIWQKRCLQDVTEQFLMLDSKSIKVC